METQILDTDNHISELVDKYSDMVLRLALTYVKNIHDAQDICQNVFVKVFKQNNTFTDSEHEKAWIIRVTINECKDFMRSFWKKRFCCINEVTLPIENTENREVVSLVLELPEKYRSVVYLYYFENYSTAEIAELLDRKETTIRTQMKRARELLKRKIINNIKQDNSQNNLRGFTFKPIVITILAVCTFTLVTFIGMPFFENSNHAVTQEKEHNAVSSIFNGFEITTYANTQASIEIKPNVEFILGRYNLTMNNVPGLPVRIVCDKAEIIKLTVTDGELLLWNPSDSIVINKGSKLEIKSWDTIYWTPISENRNGIITNCTLTIEAYKNDRKLGSNTINIKSDSNGNYSGIVSK